MTSRLANKLNKICNNKFISKYAFHLGQLSDPVLYHSDFKKNLKCFSVINRQARNFSSEAEVFSLKQTKEIGKYLDEFHLNMSKPLDKENLERTWDLYCQILSCQQLSRIDTNHILRFVKELLKRDAEKKELLNRCHRVLRDFHTEGVIFNLDFYKSLIEFCSDNNFLTELISLTDDIKISGIKLDTSSYNLLLRTFGDEKRKKMFFRFYNEMREENVLPDMNTLYDMARINLSLSRIFETEALILELRPLVTCNSSLMEKTVCLLIRSFIGIKEYSSAEKWYNELSNMPEVTFSTRGYNTGIQLYRKIDSTPHRMLATYEKLAASGNKPNVHTFVPLLSGLVEMNTSQLVFDFLEPIKIYQLDEKTAIKNIVVRAYAISGHMDKALELFKSMRCASNIENSSIDVITYSEIIKGFCSLDDLEAARFWFREMGRDRVRPDTWIYNTLIHHHMRLQQVQHGIKYFNELLLLPEGAPNASTYSSVMVGLLQSNQIEEAMNAYYHMKGRSITPALSNYTQLMQALGKIGKMDLAIKLFEDMQQAGVQPNSFTFSAMLQGFALQQNLDAINDLYMLIKMDTTRDPDGVLWNSLMNAYNLAGDFSSAVQIWDSLWYTEYPLDSCAASIILDCCSHHDQPDHFHAIWKNLQSSRFQLEDNNYSSYVEGLARMGEVKKAIDFVTRDMKNLGLSPSEKTISTLLNFLRKYEKSSEQRHVLAVYLKDSFPEFAPLISRLVSNF